MNLSVHFIQKPSQRFRDKPKYPHKNIVYSFISLDKYCLQSDVRHLMHSGRVPRIVHVKFKLNVLDTNPTPLSECRVFDSGIT